VGAGYWIGLPSGHITREAAVATHEIPVDVDVPLSAEPHTGHNRWHPDIPPVLRVAPGDEVVMATRDALDGVLPAGATPADLAKVDFGLVHPLTGPVYVEGAEPGDVLVVDILEVAPPSHAFTIQAPGFGFLRDEFGDPFLVNWDLADGFATSADLPGVRIPGAPFMGVMGVAPSHGLMVEIKMREADLAGRGGLVLLPDAAGAIPSAPSIAATALRTVPPRENGGNLDIKHLTAGTRVYFPVWTAGALFSAGDAHYAQGDGEACGTAIEMTATLRVRLDVRKGQAAVRGTRDLAYTRIEPPAAAVPGPYYATTGLCVGRDGTNRAEDVTLAARNALLNMIDHLGYEYGYSRQQAYAICSVAVDLKIAELVDVPNVLVTATLPLDIFA
jgi:formamidase